MHRPMLGPYLSAVLLLLAETGASQDDPAALEAAEPEIRRYSVELIVFAYAEDVSTGSEVFLPEIVEVEPSSMPDAAGQPSALEGPIPDDSRPADDRNGNRMDLPEGVFAAGNGGFVNESGERVNERGERVDAYGRVIVDDAAYATVFFGDDDLTMLDVYDRLDRLDAYDPLLHVGWSQVALAEEETKPLTIGDFGVPVDRLDGAFTLYLSRYLHLVVDLELDADVDAGTGLDAFGNPVERPLSYEETIARYGSASDRRRGERYEDDVARGRDYGRESGADPAQTRMTMVMPLRYSISENRIMNSGDTRYFDHPKFGVIARVDRVETPELIPGSEGGDDTDVLLPVGGQ